MNLVKSILSKEKLPLIVLSFTILMGLAFAYFSFDGFYFYDDMIYMKYAWQMTKGNFVLTSDNFCHAFGFVV